MRFFQLPAIALGVFGVLPLTNALAQPGGIATFQSDYVAYQSACETLPRANVDCACVAKAHATWAHMSPDRAYATYLFERYKQSIGLPNRVNARLQEYFDQGDEAELRFRSMQAFDPIDRADPFRNDSVNGCVIPGAPRPELGPLPANDFYHEVLPIMVRSSGRERLDRCVLIETDKLMSAAAFEARTRVGNLASATAGETPREAAARRMNVPLDVFDQLVREADSAYAQAGVTTREPGSYCMALLAAEDSQGSIIDRYSRDKVSRAGPPIGMEMIDVTQSRQRISGTLEDQVAQMQAEARSVAAAAQEQNADVIADLEAYRSGERVAGGPSREEMESLPAKQREMAAEIAKKDGPAISRSELSAACERSVSGAAFCDCFVPRFVDEIVPIAGATAPMLAVSTLADGFDPMRAIALTQTMDMGVLMRVSPQVDELVQSCGG